MNFQGFSSILEDFMNFDGFSLILEDFDGFWARFFKNWPDFFKNRPIFFFFWISSKMTQKQNIPENTLFLILVQLFDHFFQKCAQNFQKRAQNFQKRAQFFQKRVPHPSVLQNRRKSFKNHEILENR